MFKTYYQLTKPGIIYGNAITATAGFLLASSTRGGGRINFWLLLAALIGLSFIIASGCVFNNLLDRDIDGKMARTKNRALVVGEIPNRNAIVFGTVLGFLGVFVLALHANLLAMGVALFGLFVYVVLYTPLKRRSVYGTVVGSLAGAVPPVVGYCAVTGHFDIGSLILFFILVSWQMPHFYAIAIFRLKDYVSAGIPVLPAVKGVLTTKIYMMVYIVVFIIATHLLVVFGFTGHLYAAISGLLGLSWLGLAITGFKTNTDDTLWARKMFFFSLVVLVLLCAIISTDALLNI